MKLAFILALKSYREHGIIDILLMFMIALASFYKETFLVFSLIPIFFSGKLFNIIWDNENEKFFYLQFDQKELKKIASFKQFFFLIEFNVVYVLFLLYFYSHFGLSSFKDDYWIVLNIFMLINLILGNMLFNYGKEKKSMYKDLIKLILFLLSNVLTVFVIFYIETYSDSPFVILLSIFIILFLCRFLTLNFLFSNFKKICIHD